MKDIFNQMLELMRDNQEANYSSKKLKEITETFDKLKK